MTMQMGATLHWYEGGSHHNPPVVLLHGTAGLHGLWTPQLVPLSVDFHVLAPDLIYDKWRDFSIKRLATDVAVLVEANARGAAHFVGLSLGAMVALQTAIDTPDVVKSLTLIGGRAKGENPLVLRWMTRLLPGVTVQNQLLNSTRARMPDMDMDLEVEREIRRVGRRGFLAAIDAMSEVDFTADLPNVTQPTLLLVGEKELDSRKAMVDELLNRLPNARKQSIPDAGLHANLENPAAFTQAVTDFIKSVEAKA